MSSVAAGDGAAPGESGAASEVVLALVPTRRDGEATEQLLRASGIECRTEWDVERAAAAVRHGVGVLTVTDLTLASAQAVPLLTALAAQPEWSQLPVVALCREGSSPPLVESRLAALRNVTVLDRPTSARTLLSTLRAALRARRWQYQLRDQLVALREAEQALRDADRRKDEFLATLAHELRNPLAALKNGTALLARLDGAAPQLRQLRLMMERQIEQLVKLIDDLLDVSRIASGKIVLRFERLDLRQVVAAAIEGCQPALQAADHTLQTQLPDAAVWVDGDLLRLTQALSNLLHNAAKYTPRGGRLRVALESAELPELDGAGARLIVEDNGVGIPPPMLDRVFDLFTQINQTLHRAQGGLGIGLSLVKRLVELHGGTVGAASDGDGRGSRFTITLPAASAPEAGAGSATGAESPDAAPAPAQRPLRVLVVDDNVDAADSLAQLLESLGHQTCTDYDGRSALAHIGGFAPDVVFCDLGMPGLDGLGFGTELRRDPRFAATLLVAVTGWGSDSDKARSADAGFDHHVTKPVSAAGLARLLAAAR